MTLQDNRDYGVEQWATEAFAWEHVDKGYYDLVAADGTKVEAKGCLRWVNDGRRNGRQKQIRGRFRLWSEEHDKLVADAGEYLFVVYESTDFDEPWAWRRMPAHEVTNLVDTFYNYTFRRSKGETAHLSWRHVFPESVEE